MLTPTDDMSKGTGEHEIELDAMSNGDDSEKLAELGGSSSKTGSLG